MGATTSRPEVRPRVFERAVAELAAATWRPEVSVDEMPAPQRIAPFSAALAADVTIADEEVGGGRFVLLHDPAGNPAWEGTFRCVTFARAEVDVSMASDPLLPSVGWSWLTDSLANHDAAYVEPGGTVTCAASRSFGQLADHEPRADIEIRASWTPELADDGSGLTPHLMAWADLLCSVAGLPPLPPGVVAMTPRRGAGTQRR